MDLLIWAYIISATILMVHEIDSGYWKEWELFKLPGGQSFFMIIHIPLVALILYGLIEVYQKTTAGTVFSIILASAGIIGFCLHTYFLLKGKKQFDVLVSKVLIIAMLISSLTLLFMSL